MIVEMLLKGGISLGCAALPINGPAVFGDFVMGGKRRAAAGIIADRAAVDG